MKWSVNNHMAGWTWKHRESNRLRNGTYRKLPFHNESWFKNGPGLRPHYAHLSKDDPTKIAFTENEAKGRKDLQVRLRPGRYLQRFYGHVLDENQIRDYATKVSSMAEDTEFKIAMDSDQIEHVYRNGPDSCMSYGISSFDSSIHPVRVYGAGDLGVAYIERHGRVTARALCWPERKVYTRIYGDSIRLEKEFSGRGFRQHCVNDRDQYVSAFLGAKLLKIEQRRYERNNFVVPYVDYHKSIKEEGDYLVLCEDGPISCAITSGLAPVCRGVKCPKCSDWYEDEEFILLHDMIDVKWCTSCAQTESWTCYACKNRCGASPAFYLNSNSRRRICQPCSVDYIKCEACNKWGRIEESRSITVRNLNNNENNEIDRMKLCRECVSSEYNEAFCEYFYIHKDLNTKDCGCQTCRARVLEIEGQQTFAGMPFFTGSRAPAEYTIYLEENPSEGAPNA